MALIAGFDTETTGLEPGDHRFVEVFAGLYDTKSRQCVFAFETRIDPQRNIPADVQRIHGISAADVIGKPIWEDVGPKLHKVLSRAAAIVAHNGVGFDMPFVNHEFKRIGLPAIETPCVDTMLHGRHATPTGAVPNLGALCFGYGVDYDPAQAHAARYDVDKMMECFFRGLDWGFFTLPNLELAHAAA